MCGRKVNGTLYGWSVCLIVLQGGVHSQLTTDLSANLPHQSLINVYTLYMFLISLHIICQYRHEVYGIKMSQQGGVFMIMGGIHDHGRHTLCKLEKDYLLSAWSEEISLYINQWSIYMYIHCNCETCDHVRFRWDTF